MPDFQQRHYRTIAAQFQTILARTKGKAAKATVKSTVETFADMFGRDNLKFNRALFLAACEPGANVNARTAEGARGVST